MTDVFVELRKHAALIKQLQGATINLQTGRLTTTFVPAWTGSVSNPAILNGVQGGAYLQLGDIVHATWFIVAGSTTTFGSGTYNLALPVTARSSERWALSVDALDAGTQHYVGTAIINGGSTFEEIIVGSSATGPTTWGATTPFTFGNADRLVISGVYAAA